jgi:hypothetical protein
METAKDWVASLLKGDDHANKCEVCGNEYQHCFEVRMNGGTHIFDSFECAIQALAPRCTNCGCRILGHGVEADGVFYCCAHCVRRSDIHRLESNVSKERSKI